MRSKKFQALERKGISEVELRKKIEESIAEGDEEEIASQQEGSVIEWVKGAAIAICVALAILQFVKPTVVQQHSMEPNFYTNDYLFISRQSYKLFGGTPKLGDVVVFNTELQTDEGENKLLIKRVIGTPGDVIDIKNGKVYVNGQEIDDSYTNDHTTNGDLEGFVVPVDTVFCMGDNRLVSVDSRSDEIGCVPYDQIMGKVVFRLLPINKIGAIHNPYDKE